MINTDPHRLARKFCIDQLRQNVRKLPILMGGVVMERVVTIPARRIDPAYVRLCGQDVALILVDGVLQTDRVVSL